MPITVVITKSKMNIFNVSKTKKLSACPKWFFAGIPIKEYMSQSAKYCNQLNMIDNLLTTVIPDLNRRTFNGAIAAKNTAITGFRFYCCLAIGAYIKILAGIRWHRFLFFKPAKRAFYRRDCN